VTKEPKELTKEREALLKLLKQQNVKGPFAPVFGKLKQLLVASGAEGTLEMWIKLSKDMPAVLDEVLAEIKKKRTDESTKKHFDVFSRVFSFTKRYVAYIHEQIVAKGVPLPKAKKMPKSSDLDSFGGDAPARSKRSADLLGNVDAPIEQPASAGQKPSGGKEKGKEKKWVNPALGKIPIR
jgi:hypothetical protein